MKAQPIHFAKGVARGLSQLDLFADEHDAPRFKIDTTQEINLALGLQSPVFISVSGGRDSQALAYRVTAHLDEVGHVGSRMLIHSDLGRVEWQASLPTCERLAQRLGLELIVVRRQAGDMMDRWLSRWQGNVRRYTSLECVKLIMPWSGSQARFCQSEMKAAVLSSAMRKRYPKGDVISAVGIRREESNNRARMPVWHQDARTTRKTGAGHTWNAILGWNHDDVGDYIAYRGDYVHEAYTTYHSSRVSCVYCIFGSEGDLRASTRCAATQATYLEMVGLEILSSFSFQANRWLGDVAPDLLDVRMRAGLHEAKERAAERMAAEAVLPRDLLFVKGWPVAMPTAEEGRLIADVRRRVANAVGLEIQFTDEVSVLARYGQLMEAKIKGLTSKGLALSIHGD